MFRTNFLLIIALFLCGRSTVHCQVLSFQRFPKTIDIKFEKDNSISNNIIGVNIYQDSLLLIRNDQPYHHHFTLYNIKTKNKNIDILGSGRGKNQSMGFMSYGMINHTIWVHDIIKDKIINVGIQDSSLMDEKPFKRFFYSIQMMNESQTVGFGDYDSNYKIFTVKLDGNRSVVTDSLFRYPENFKKVDKMDYESFIYIDSSASYAALASRYSDQVEFFSLKNKTSKIISGPENYVPELGRMKYGSSDISSRNSKTRYGFLGGKGKSKYLYLLYSGNNHNSKYSFYGNRIFVYNWQGEPIADIKLDRYIIDFDISADGKTMYAVDGVKNEILKASFII